MVSNLLDILKFFITRIANSTRQMSQPNMIPAHQAHMHLHRGIHSPQQIISMNHQPMHHMQNSGPRQPMMITQNSQNPNGSLHTLMHVID